MTTTNPNTLPSPGTAPVPGVDEQLTLLPPDEVSGLSPIEAMGGVDAASAHIAEFAPTAGQLDAERTRRAERVVDARGGEDLQAEQAPVIRDTNPAPSQEGAPFVRGRVKELPNQTHGQPSTKAPSLVRQKLNARNSISGSARARIVEEITEQRKEVLETPIRSYNRQPYDSGESESAGPNQADLEGLASARARLPRG